MLCQSNAFIPWISITESSSGISKHYVPFIYLNVPIVNAKCMTSIVVFYSRRDRLTGVAAFSLLEVFHSN